MNRETGEESQLRRPASATAFDLQLCVTEGRPRHLPGPLDLGGPARRPGGRCCPHCHAVPGTRPARGAIGHRWRRARTGRTDLYALSGRGKALYHAGNREMRRHATRTASPATTTSTSPIARPISGPPGAGQVEAAGAARGGAGGWLATGSWRRRTRECGTAWAPASSADARRLRPHRRDGLVRVRVGPPGGRQPRPTTPELRLADLDRDGLAPKWSTAA